MRYFVLLILCLISGFGQAQDFKRFAFGLKAGGGWGGWYTYPSYYTDYSQPNQELGPRFVPAYTFGISGKYRLPARISINLDILYLSGGSRLVNNFSGIHYALNVPFENVNEQTLRINSLRTPVYLSWEVTQWQVQPIVSMGASYNRIIGGHRNIYSYLSTTGEKRDENQSLLLDIPSNSDLVHDLSFYAAIGLSIKDRLLVEANLWLGPLRGYYFADPSTIDFSPTIDYAISESSYHNRAILITLSYLLVGG